LTQHLNRSGTGFDLPRENQVADGESNDLASVFARGYIFEDICSIPFCFVVRIIADLYAFPETIYFLGQISSPRLLRLRIQLSSLLSEFCPERFHMYFKLLSASNQIASGVEPS
jgi:hypothetical protein